ncbi:PI-PLC X-box domain-containing protein [Pyrus ussuriensis x Pyrus communis]|uniref:PI-PLC X-box domain-containing protein n=1 Tax=Pyrus ussuriensis x Pyrus communis TaxID=2448454 RepID=A0A5N5FN90_9ROSA|nr:PI-PLC X-box domain-containing protein [Pyrus ussuriensis x Pyrus communis]
MGSCFPKQLERRKAISTERKALRDLHQSVGEDFPACAYRPPDRKNWMAGINPKKPFGQCQTMSIYKQLVTGTRVLDIRVQKDRRVCHGILITYHIDVVIKDIKKFLSETKSEIILLEIRTEYGHQDPPDFDKYLVDQLGETISELLPKRIICVWKPRNSPSPEAGAPLWNSVYLNDDWIDTDLPSTKFENNLKCLSEQPPISSRKFLYRVENTVTPQADNPIVCVRPVTQRIHEFARLFITECFCRGIADRLQIFSTDFIDEDFVDACVAVTYSRIDHGKA